MATDLVPPSPEFFYNWISTATIMATVVITVWSLSWWLSSQFKDVRSLVYAQVGELREMFSKKLDYHEKHDDQRFGAITNDIWDIKVRNAARDGRPLDIIKKLKKFDEEN